MRQNWDGVDRFATVDEWVKYTGAQPAANQQNAKTDTMDGYACTVTGTCFAIQIHITVKQAWDPNKTNYWAPLDYYVGGDHVVKGHLLYVRFWNHVFKEMGLVAEREPVKKIGISWLT